VAIDTCLLDGSGVALHEADVSSPRLAVIASRLADHERDPPRL
jgi:hypothetical protein